MTDYKAIKLMRNGVEYCFPSGGGGGGGGGVEVLVVGGGGCGGAGNAGGGGGGGGAGALCYVNNYYVDGDSFIPVVAGYSAGTSQFGDIIMVGGGRGGSCALGTFGYGGTGGFPGGSGGGGGGNNTSCTAVGGNGLIASTKKSSCGSNGSNSASCTAAMGGGWYSNSGYGFLSSIEGTEKCYAGGGGGGGYNAASCGQYGGGNGACYNYLGCPATCCGSGGGGGGCCKNGGLGGCGVVIVRYHTDGSDGITEATGGCKYECGDYTIHCFTYGNANCWDTFKVGNPKGCWIRYTVIGGGGAGSYGGGGGGAVCAGIFKADTNSYNIVVGTGGTTQGANGTASCLGDKVIANGGCGASTYTGGASGSGYAGGYGATTCCTGGGGGAAQQGSAYSLQGYLGYKGGFGGRGLFGYGGGGAGACNSAGLTEIGRVDGACAGGYTTNRTYTNANGFGGGGGGNYCVNYFGCGCNGRVIVCYPADGSFGFTCATGGDSCSCACGWCIHSFGSNGTFTIVS